MTTLDAMKQALAAMHDHGTSYLNHEDEYATAIDCLSVAIAELEKAASVAINTRNVTHDVTVTALDARFHPVHEEGYQKLYAAPIESKHWEITAKQLGKQLDECERERNELRNFMSQHSADLNRCGATLLDFHVIWREQDQKQLAIVTKERDELLQWKETASRLLREGRYKELSDELAAMTKERDVLLRKVEYWRDIAKA